MKKSTNHSTAYRESLYGETISQRDRVLGDLRRAGLLGVCSKVWYSTGVPNSRNYISTLRAERHHIVSVVCADDHGPTYRRYVLFHGPERVCNACPWQPAQLELINAART
jgi:hypothetical protein